jgi:hypothetical protein
MIPNPYYKALSSHYKGITTYMKPKSGINFNIMKPHHDDLEYENTYIITSNCYPSRYRTGIELCCESISYILSKKMKKIPNPFYKVEIPEWYHEEDDPNGWYQKYNNLDEWDRNYIKNKYLLSKLDIGDNHKLTYGILSCSGASIHEIWNGFNPDTGELIKFIVYVPLPHEILFKNIKKRIRNLFSKLSYNK